MHWKILSSEMTKDRSWLIAQSRHQKSGKFIEWFNMKINSSRQLHGHSNIYFHGVSGFLLGKNKYCFEISKGDKSEAFYELKIRNESSTITFRMKCDAAGGKKISAREHKMGKAGPDECKLSPCKSQSGALKACKGTGCRKGLPPRPDLLAVNKPLPEETGSKNLNVNEEMLSFFIDSAFMNLTTKSYKSVERLQSSWRVLEKLFSIVKNLCSCLVPGYILDSALELFKVAHYGQGYEYAEHFSASQATELLEILDRCEASSKSLDMSPNCERNNCTGRVCKDYYILRNTF
jgi:hypothetical protein